MRHAEPLIQPTPTMTTPPVPLLLAAFILVSCDEPRQRVAELETPPVPATAPQQAPVVLPTDPETPAPAVTSPAQEELDLPPAEPELSVALVGKKIRISGALRSRIQVERIVEDLTNAFPDHEIESDLKIEYHRIAVGWGNRVADPFLVVYLQDVESPVVSYRENTLRLEGKVKGAGKHREISEFAVETFAGDTTEKVENKIVIE